MMMEENDIDLFVHPENLVPTPKIQGPNVGPISQEGITPFLQIPRIVVPAGIVRSVLPAHTWRMSSMAAA